MMQSISADIKEFNRLYMAENDFTTGDLQAIHDISDNMYDIICNALKVGFTRGYNKAQADAEREGQTI